MTITIELNPSQIQGIREFNEQQAKAIAAAARAKVIADGQFVFFAAFDGTNNNADKNVAPGQYSTNVWQLWSQYKAAMSQDNPASGGQYYPGPGTEKTLTNSAWLPPAVTQQVIATAEQAYEDFAFQASEWLGTDGNAGKPMAVALTSFSRGDASAAIFSQMLYQRGLVDPNAPNDVLIAPGKVKVCTGVIFDPVTTGAVGNLAFAPNVGNVVAVKALNEYRYLFPSSDYSNQAGAITTLGMYGNHCDIGGGYDRGIGALSLGAATEFFKSSGLPIAAVQASRTYQPEAIGIHSEEYDEYGKKLWDVTNEEGFSFNPDLRLVVKVGMPASPGSAFTLYDGVSVTIA